MAEMELTIGADPEVFLEKDGQIISAYGLIPGTKRKPFHVPHGGVQVDGMAGEFNIDPVVSSKEFHYSINKVLAELLRMVPGASISNACTHIFDSDYFASQPDDAKLLGCDPDFNAYSLECNRSPDIEATPTMRTVAGHIHLGWTKDVDTYSEEHFLECTKVTRQLDYFLGLPSLVLDNTPESALRRQMYGKAGTFRPKPYGMEYRVLSNFWIFSEQLQEWAFNQTKCAYETLRSGDDWYEKYNDVAKYCIDNNDVQYAKDFLESVHQW
jgi:hypothetical protein